MLPQTSFPTALVRTAALAGVALLGVAAWAQPAPGPKTADEAWTDLVALTKPAPAAKIRGGDKPPAETKSKIRQQAERARFASEQARNFHVFNPGHPRAGEARKLEALFALRAVMDGDTAQEKLAVSLATALRDNKTLPAADRFEVALALERFNHSLKLKAKTAADTTAAWVKLGEALQKEFGDLPALAAYYVELARKADSATAVAIATEVVKSASAAPAVRAEARSIVDRAAMVGKPLAVKLPRIGGGEVDLALQRNKITALVVWSPTDPDMLAPLKAFPNGLPEGVQMVYLAIGKVSEVLNAQGRLPLRGVNCYTPPRDAGKAIGTALNLRYAPAPCVYLLDRSGNVAAIGRLGELPVLLKKTLG